MTQEDLSDLRAKKGPASFWDTFFLYSVTGLAREPSPLCADREVLLGLGRRERGARLPPPVQAGRGTVFVPAPRVLLGRLSRLGPVLGRDRARLPAAVRRPIAHALHREHLPIARANRLHGSVEPVHPRHEWGDGAGEAEHCEE